MVPSPAPRGGGGGRQMNTCTCRAVSRMKTPAASTLTTVPRGRCLLTHFTAGQTETPRPDRLSAVTFTWPVTPHWRVGEAEVRTLTECHHVPGAPSAFLRGLVDRLGVLAAPTHLSPPHTSSPLPQCRLLERILGVKCEPPPHSSRVQTVLKLVI